MKLRSIVPPEYHTLNSRRTPVTSTIREDEVKVIDQISEALDELHGGENRVPLNTGFYSRSGTIRILLRFAIHHLSDFETWYKTQTRGF